LPASDPVALGIFPGASLLIAMFATALAAAFGVYLLWRAREPWWTLLGALLMLLTLSLSLTTMGFIVGNVRRN